MDQFAGDARVGGLTGVGNDDQLGAWSYAPELPGVLNWCA
jgi:hypothetical protein